MERQVRLSRLLSMLDTHPMMSVDELAARLGVSDRTIYRDLAELRAGGHDVSRKAGYSVGETEARRIGLGREEIEALALGAQMVGAWGDPALSAAAVRMLDKVAGALPGAQQRSLDHVPLSASRAKFKFERVAGLGKLRRALAERRKLYFRYADAEERLSERVVQPRSLVFRGDHWSLLAWCEVREEYRSFRPERMRDVCVLEEGYRAFDDPRGEAAPTPAGLDAAIEAGLDEEEAMAPVKVSA